MRFKYVSLQAFKPAWNLSSTVQKLSCPWSHSIYISGAGGYVDTLKYGKNVQIEKILNLHVTAHEGWMWEKKSSMLKSEWSIWESPSGEEKQQLQTRPNTGCWLAPPFPKAKHPGNDLELEEKPLCSVRGGWALRRRQYGEWWRRCVLRTCILDEYAGVEMCAFCLSLSSCCSGFSKSLELSGVCSW